MKSSYILNFLFAVLLLVSSGCVVALGNNGADKHAPTRGQELIDLKKAKDAGALSEEDYQSQKKAIMERH